MNEATTQDRLDARQGIGTLILTYSSALSKVGVVAVLAGALWWVTQVLVPEYRADRDSAIAEAKLLAVECRTERAENLAAFRTELAAERTVFKTTLQEERRYTEANTLAIRELTTELRITRRDGN